MGPQYLRVLVSASRSWHKPLDIWTALGHCLTEAQRQGKTLVVVHGDADGGDQIAKLFGQVHEGAVDEPHPADWDGPCRPRCRPGHRKTRKDGTTFCPAAGMYRNDEMAGSGLWRAACFIRRRSSGTTRCATSVRRAGLRPVIRRDDD
jgi:hypothetical protein